MRNLPPRTSPNLALTLRCCPHCMGDLEFRSDFSGEYYTCLQCSERAEPAAAAGHPAGRGAQGRARITPPGIALS